MRQDVKSVVNNLISKYGTRNPYELCDYTNTIYQILISVMFWVATYLLKDKNALC